MRALLLLPFLLTSSLGGAQTPRLLQAEYFWDTDPGAGSAIPMNAADGELNTAFEQAMASDTTHVTGLHKLGVRVKGSDGSWGPVFATIVDVVQLRQVRLQEFHIYWDDQENSIPATYIDFSGPEHAFESISTSIPVPPEPGLHRMSVRARTADNQWGPVFTTVVDAQLRQARIRQAEYFWDTDPGPGSGTQMVAMDGIFFNSFEQAHAPIANTLGLSTGLHVLHTRVRGLDGAWSSPFRTVVQVDPPPPVTVTFDLRVALQGCMGAAALMNNPLRSAGLIPFSEPYTALGHDLGLNAGATTTSAVMNVTFPPGASVVDWILVEFRPALAPWQITASLPLLVRRGGTVATPDGTYPFLLSLPAASYYVVVRHRNHLPVSTATPVAINTNGQTVAINFTATSSIAYGTDAQALTGSLYCLWAGDVDRNGLLKYTGFGNDRDPILSAIGGAVPTNTTSGYSLEDVNMDGSVKYVGSTNDRDPILSNIGGVIPTASRSAQLPY